MADKHPYISAPGPLVQSLEQLRKSFPTSVSSDTLKKLALAPSNESFVINILKFIGLLDEEGKRTPAAQATFSMHADPEFHAAFEKLVEKAYADLFALHSKAAWDLDRDKLISFFRTSDQTSALVGQRQAVTFRALAAFAGHGDPPPTGKGTGKHLGDGKNRQTKQIKPSISTPARASNPPSPPASNAQNQSSPVGLTVRIEINLPAQGDQETYDRIFASIRENLLNGR